MPPIRLVGVNSAAEDLAGWISDDGQTILFHSNRTGDYEIYQSQGDASTGVYALPQPIAELNQVGSTDASARFVRGGLVVTFYSNRENGPATDDLYSATRATLQERFSNIRQIDGVNEPLGFEQDPWLSEDLCYLAFTKTDVDGLNKFFEASCIE